MVPMKKAGLGIDLAEVERFRPLIKQKGHAALRRLFTDAERAYCFSYRDAAPHFAGTFAAKEAASKAMGAATYPFLSLEIRRAADGTPEVWKGGRRLRVRISITHTASVAAAVALV